MATDTSTSDTENKASSPDAANKLGSSSSSDGDATQGSGKRSSTTLTEHDTVALEPHSPPPANAPTTGPEPAAPAVAARDTEVNDAVSALQAMFPGMDKPIISEVLAAHGGNADAASIALLELNNPTPATTGNNVGSDGGAATAAAQMQADEEYARQLMAQMEREHMQEFGRPLGTTPAPRQQNASSGVNYDQLNYVPRQRNRHGQASPQPQQYSQDQHGEHGQQAGLGQWIGGQTGPDGRWKHQDELDQLTEQFNKFADTGKKTFNSFLSKAKDKYAQAAQQRALQAQGNQPQGSGSGAGVTIGGFKLPNIPSPWQGGTGFRPGEKPMSPEREELRTGPLSPDTRSSVMKDYSQSPSRPSALDSRSRSSSDDERPAIQINKALPTTSQSQPIRAASSTNAPALSSSPATASPGFSTSPPHLAQQQARNSFSSSPARVQMLPRQTINLLDQDKDRNSRSASPAAAGGATGSAAAAGSTKKDKNYDDDSDSDVEYVRNPFNDDD